MKGSILIGVGMIMMLIGTFMKVPILIGVIGFLFLPLGLIINLFEELNDKE